jgi:hypothetical protein
MTMKARGRVFSPSKISIPEPVSSAIPLKENDLFTLKGDNITSAVVKGLKALIQSFYLFPIQEFTKRFFSIKNQVLL